MLTFFNTLPSTYSTTMLTSSHCLFYSTADFLHHLIQDWSKRKRMLRKSITMLHSTVFFHFTIEIEKITRSPQLALSLQILIFTYFRRDIFVIHEWSYWYMQDMHRSWAASEKNYISKLIRLYLKPFYTNQTRFDIKFEF